jgi:hypothetical protein
MTNRMRRILLALIALAFLRPAAEAARRDESGRQQATSRPAQQTPAARTTQAQRGKATVQRAARRTTARRAAPTRHRVRQQARSTSTRRAALRPGDVRTSRSGLVVRGASAATVSRESMARSRSRGRSIAGWQAGLPRADFAQTECPDGTFATLARGHQDVVRCMPL